MKKIILILSLGFVFCVSAIQGQTTVSEAEQKDVTILDVFENAASVKVIASDWVDYLHVAKFNGRWVIVNVL